MTYLAVTLTALAIAGCNPDDPNKIGTSSNQCNEAGSSQGGSPSTSGTGANNGTGMAATAGRGATGTGALICSR